MEKSSGRRAAFKVPLVGGRSIVEVRGNENEIRAYIKRHEGLAALLMEAERRLRSEFGDAVPLALEAVHDPELGKEEGLLYLVVKSDLDVSDAEARLDRVCVDWWLTLPDGSPTRHLALTVEYA